MFFIFNIFKFRHDVWKTFNNTSYRSYHRSTTVIKSNYASTEIGHTDCRKTEEIQREKINLEEITQRIINARPRKEYKYNINREPKENEEDRKTKLNFHLYRRLYPWTSKEEFATYLSHQIVYQRDGVIAINKPFGVGVRNVHQAEEDQFEMMRRSGKELPTLDPDNDPLHHTRGTGSCNYTLEDVLPLLKTKLSIPELQLQKSTDKFTSGIALFTTNHKAAEKICKLIKSNKPLGVKTYSYNVISTNISNKFLQHGTLTERVGITLAENADTKVAHPIIVRDFSKNMVKKTEVKPISVELILLDKNPQLNVCLSQLDTTATKYNFLRVYYTNIVAPILGDHLYGSRVAKVGGVFVPVPPAVSRIGIGHQVLSREVLSAIRLNQLQDSIIVPLHAHLQKLTVGNFYGKGKHLLITAPPPALFSWTCRQLSLKLPSTPTSSD